MKTIDELVKLYPDKTGKELLEIQEKLNLSETNNLLNQDDNLTQKEIAEKYWGRFESSWGILITDGLGVVKPNECTFYETSEHNYLKDVVSVNFERLSYDAKRFNLPNLVDTEEIMFVELTMRDGSKIQPDYSLLKINLL